MTPAREPSGLLELGIAVKNGRSYARHQRHSGTLRVLRPHYLETSGRLTYTVLNPGGAYFGGDSYLLDVRVDPGASLSLYTQSATKVYRTPQGRAEQTMDVHLAEGASMEYLPDQLIMYRGASFRQHTVVHMHPRARVVMAEIITPGWSPDGSDFAFDELRMSTDIMVHCDKDCDKDCDKGEFLLAADRLRLVPEEGVRGVGVMEGRSHSGQLVCAAPDIDEALFDRLATIVSSMDAEISGRSGITRAGVTVRGGAPDVVLIRTLAHRTGDIAALHAAVVGELRRSV
ncbi:urease accessory protein UreD [Corynebacterium pacaense]|uniref:urease accessory protein UreD n=1 Tax=Corynebacterium pacaense TaxID=1816684 RepID=UPI0009B9BA42|nr:urease accessory protein UreD [Corynebacterium pacaense]